jgi:hypothetical protein
MNWRNAACAGAALIVTGLSASPSLAAPAKLGDGPVKQGVVYEDGETRNLVCLEGPSKGGGYDIRFKTLMAYTGTITIRPQQAIAKFDDFPPDTTQTAKNPEDFEQAAAAPGYAAANLLKYAMRQGVKPRSGMKCSPF